MQQGIVLCTQDLNLLTDQNLSMRLKSYHSTRVFRDQHPCRITNQTWTAVPVY